MTGNKFVEEYIRYVLNDTHKILENKTISDDIKLIQIQEKIRKWYFRCQKSLKYDQDENQGLSIFEYYNIQHSLVKKQSLFSERSIDSWKKEMVGYEKQKGIEVLKKETIQSIYRYSAM